MKSPRRAKNQAPPEKGNHLMPEFGGFFGKTGSGKSHAMWQKYQEWQASDQRQTLVWSPKEPQDDYAGRLRCNAYRNIHELILAVRKGRDAVFVPTLNREQDEPVFDLFNRLAMAITPCCLIVDELHTITRPTGGVPAWHYNTTMGRGAGLRILASSQRPAHVDKDFFGSLSYAWCGCQLFEDDAKTTARLVLCTPQEIMGLTGHDAKTRSM